ncbi:MAG: hypothetical protein NTV48_03675 [Candidatus Vogelbacteria bacterium]|nr:hypothetical protein [Candidatus Vogelbacteria bacterium]
MKVKAWLSSLPEDTPIDKNKWVGWIERYVVSIPYAEEMSRIIDNDNLSPELKVSFFQELVESLSEEERHKFYLERYGELNDISNDMEEAFKDLDREEKGEALDSLLKAVLKTKITGQGVREIYKLLEEKLGKGSFKRLAHKYARVVKKEP